MLHKLKLILSFSLHNAPFFVALRKEKIISTESENLHKVPKNGTKHIKSLLKKQKQMQFGKIKRPFTKNQWLFFAYLEDETLTDDNDLKQHGKDLIVGTRRCEKEKQWLSLKIKGWSLVSLLRFNNPVAMAGNVVWDVRNNKPFIWLGYGCFVDIYNEKTT